MALKNVIVCVLPAVLTGVASKAYGLSHWIGVSLVVVVALCGCLFIMATRDTEALNRIDNENTLYELK